MMAGSSERAEQAVNFIGAAWTKSREDDKWYPVLFAFDGDGKRIYFWPPYHLDDKLGAPVSLMLKLNSFPIWKFISYR